ncbi:putative late blight resistance protein-like protein R1A-6 [Forsythia ovata]|uniref:Late blight resistance protein-like protein R1A-6 n=1 Tax=Forsythia ovata TaxID=205694 RepID=A0ABD1T5I9_9LAMI
MALSTFHLREVLETESFYFLTTDWFDPSQKFETLHYGYGKFVLLLIRFTINFHSEDDKVIDLVKQLNNSAARYLYNAHSGFFEDFCKMLVSSMKELEVFFAVPKPHLSETTSSLKTNELVVVFIDFLVGILEMILHRRIPYFTSCVKDLIEDLQTQLKFLITFLGDTLLQPTEETKSLLTDIEALVNEVASFLYSFILKPITMETGMDLAISDFLKKIELLKMKIKDHCIMVSMMQSGLPTKTSMISVFVVDSLLNDLKDLMDQKADKIGGVKDQIRTIHDDLLYFRSFLREIEMQQLPKLEQVMMRIPDTAHEIEYIVNSFAPVWYLEIRLPHVMEKIKLIRMAFEEMKKNHENGILANSPSQQVSLQAEKPLISEEIMVGFEDEAKNIKEQLCGEAKQLKVISISGMSGIGKTTLAKKLYNDPSIVYHFDKRAWCVISQTYQKRNILIDILRSLNDFNRDVIINMKDELLAEEIYKSLKERRYLIVIDNIWNIEFWYDLKRFFPSDRTRSRILFTTQLKDLGQEASCHSMIYPLPFLSKAECWDLLRQKVFPKGHCPPELQEIGKQIAKNCHGLPIVVVVIAAVLANMEMKKSKWQKIERSLNSHINKDPSKCMDILELSYNYLPMHLKPCFLYLGVFQEDKEIPARKLMSLWISEGFIEKKQHKSVEIVAEEYLTDLIDRNLLIVAKKRSDGGIKACRIHDLMRDICLRIVEKENFLKVIKDQLPIHEQHRYHRLYIHSILPSSRSFGLHIRSLFFRLSDPSSFIFSSLKFLKVWDLSTTDLKFYEYIMQIKLPFNLRYMAVPCILPSIESLEKLEFLYVDNKEPAEIPDVFLDMVNLRHLYFSGSAEFSESCRLRAAKDKNLPINNLQSVSFLFISDEKDEKILRRSPHLVRLKCKFTVFWDSSKNTFRHPVFDFLNELESLSLSFQRRYVSPVYQGYSFTSFPLNLKKLTLRNFDLIWKEMTVIGRLTNLEVLKLQHGSIEKQQWNTNEDEFQTLKFLELDGVPIAQWNASSDHFPSLERLVLRKCNHLNKIPSSLGYIPNLQMIEVHGGKNSLAESARQIETEQRDLENEELKVIITRSQFLRRILDNLERHSKQQLKTIF